MRQGLLSDLIQFTVLNHFVGMAAFEYSSFPPLFPLFVQDPLLRSEVGSLVYLPGIIFTVDLEAFRKFFVYTDTALYDTLLKVFFYGPYALLLIGALHLWRGRSSLAEAQGRHRFLRELVLFSFAAALIVLVSLSKPQDYLHLAVLYWPLLCLGTVYAQTLLRGRRTLGWVLAAVLVLPAGVGIGYTSRLVWRLRTIHSEQLSDKRAGIYVTPSESRMLRGVVDYVRANSTPDETVAVLPYFPIVSPIEASSAGRVRHRLNRGGNRRLNAILYRIVLTQSSHSPQARTYLDRRVSEGKTRREAFRALKRFVIRGIWRLWQECYPPHGIPSQFTHKPLAHRSVR